MLPTHDMRPTHSQLIHTRAHPSNKLQSCRVFIWFISESFYSNLYHFLRTRAILYMCNVCMRNPRTKRSQRTTCNIMKMVCKIWSTKWVKYFNIFLGFASRRRFFSFFSSCAKYQTRPSCLFSMVRYKKKGRSVKKTSFLSRRVIYKCYKSALGWHTIDIILHLKSREEKTHHFATADAVNHPLPSSPLLSLNFSVFLLLLLPKMLLLYPWPVCLDKNLWRKANERKKNRDKNRQAGNTFA